MKEKVKRSTVYFDPELHRALRLKAVDTRRSISNLVNDVVRAFLSEERKTSLLLPNTRPSQL